MKQLIKCGLVLFILLSLALNASANTAGKIYKRFNQSVFLISNEEVAGDKRIVNFGTAFAIDSIGTLVTVAHLCKSGALVTDRDGRVYPILDTLWIDENLDLAVIKVAGKFKPLSLANSSDIQIGEDITVISNPSGFQNTVSTGVLSAKREDHSVLQLQHTSPISPGSSGAPLFNDYGQVIGVAQGIFAAENSQNLNFAVPIEYIPSKFLNINRSFVAYNASNGYDDFGNNSQNSLQENYIVESKVLSQESGSYNLRKDYSSLIDELDRLMGQSENDFEMYLLRAIFKHKAGDSSGAQKDIERAKYIINKQNVRGKTALEL